MPASRARLFDMNVELTGLSYQTGGVMNNMVHKNPWSCVLEQVGACNRHEG